MRLERPVDPDVVGEEASWHAVDQVTYSDAAPWPAEADGAGRPLARLPGRNSGDAAASWVAGLAATPGRGPVKVLVAAPAGNTGYLAPAEMAVTAAVDSVFVAGAVRHVVFAVDGLDVASVAVPPYEASVTLDAREGVRLLTARLTDDEGEVTSAAVPVMVYTNVPAFTASLTSSGVPELWLNRLNPAWTNRFDEHERADPDGDGVDNAQEYVAGTDASRSQSVFRLDMGVRDGALEVSFPTVPAGGFYGLGGLRRYALEQADDMATGIWQGVAGLSHVAGEGQSVSYTNRTDEAPRRFFRGRVWLEP